MFDPTSPIHRRDLLAYSAAFGGALLAGRHRPPRPTRSPRRESGIPLKKSINLWAFPYPRADDPRASACGSPRTPASTASS